ncbi:hypothetical protein A0H81_09245 [Grifola frondosa]|uniref:Zinc finger C2H2 LYAR-type domain-containing protein n=1 Tax=Grifola frondosa TaxID=5627 RepID=A0A1C7M228_GRIFR|nr:hypothetical protein A0H81_09245 [Grifola frondosa]
MVGNDIPNFLTLSFALAGCVEVVKKPQLDKHRMKCHASFTCIDCSTIFNGPAEYKSHTQCISEAEKYQKGLYKGPKQQSNGGPRGNSGGNAPNGRDNSSKYQPWARNGGRQGWGGQPRYEGTGANVTPLGTPLRMSPVTFDSPPESQANGAVSKPTTSDPPVPAASSGAVAVDAPKEKEKDKKKGEKKRKSPADKTPSAEGSDEPRKKKAKSAKDAAPLSLHHRPKLPNRQEKKDKKSKELEESQSTSAGAAIQGDGKDGAERKKSKKGKEAETDAALDAVDVAAEKGASKERKKSKKHKEDLVNGDAATESSKPLKQKPEEGVGEAVEKKEKKDKKDKTKKSKAVV